MKQSQLWLLALLTVLTFVAATTAMAEEGAGHVTGSWELGMSGINTDDNAARVNEYGSVRQEDGVSLAPQLDLEFENGGFILELESETMGPRDQMHELSIDAGRVFKFESELSVLEHTKDHETLSQMGATGANDTGGSQPNVTTDAIYADLMGLGVTAVGGASLTNPGPDGIIKDNPATPLVDESADNALAYDPAATFAQEVSNNYVVTRREWKNEAELTIPQLANITLKAGVRIETREGMEQAISLSKCTGCHVSATGKDIDERTEEYTLGATGKFGLLTVEYEYLTRQFDEQAATPSRFYLDNTKSQLLYEGTFEEFATTPDSEKDSHLIKARLDLANNTSITASYIKADIESQKSDEAGEYSFVGSDTLDSEYEGLNAKVATLLGPVRLSLRGGVYEINGPEYTLEFDERSDYTGHTLENEQEYESAESREVTEFGVDAVYRLAKASTLRLGYEYEEIDRDETELGETETHTVKAAIKTRINSAVSGRISYQFQDIDDPFGGDNATGIAQGYDGAIYDDSGLAYLLTANFVDTIANAAEPLTEGNSDTKVFYWNSVYPSRGFDATNQPDEVHEAKFSTTWSPNANMAATLFGRFSYEENDAVHYEQTTFVPGASFWYAPSDKLNLTMSYTFNNQDTENRICVGWYHG